MIYAGKNFLVLGAAESGEASVKLLVSLDANVYILDDGKDDYTKNRIRHLTTLGAVNAGELDFNRLLDDIYCVILSPAVPIDCPRVTAAVQRGIRVLGELELGFMHCNAPVLAVTGTNGKSTTVSLIYELLRGAGVRCRLLGNIGVPFTSEAKELTESDFVCLEVSSFQLESVQSFCPHVATVLNITPDHLNRHGTMERYRELKKSIFNRQTESEFAVLNADLADIVELGKDLKSEVYYYSAEREVRGSYIENGVIYFRDGAVREYILDVEELGLIGEHNRGNALCAVTFAKICGVENARIARTLREFTGIRHRLQYVDTVSGKSFYNDSKGTNIEATLTAVKAMRSPTVLIAGGSDKGYEFDRLFSELTPNIIHAVLIGETRYKLLEAAIRVGYTAVSLCPDLPAAVKISYLRAPTGGNILLSPACASFDQFTSFEERGDKFIGLVGELHEEEV